MSFFEYSFLWLDVVIAACAAGAATAAVGVHTTVRRVVFMPAALSQLAGAGVVIAFLLSHLFSNESGDPGLVQVHAPAAEAVLPRITAALLACTGAMVRGLLRERGNMTREWLLGALFVAASAAILLVGGMIPQELHDINDVLFGNALAVENELMIEVVVMAVLVLALHLALARTFLVHGFDPETAAAHGIPVRLLDSVLFLSIGITIATGTRVVGALPEFAFAVFPGMAAMALGGSPTLVILVASLLGAASAFTGYWASFELSLPTGACMAVASFATYLAAKAASRLGRS